MIAIADNGGLTNETLVKINDSWDFFPGGPPSRPTRYRWILRGIGGVRLESVMIGGTRWTSREAIVRFIRATTEQADANLTARQECISRGRGHNVSDRAEKSSAALAKRGF